MSTELRDMQEDGESSCCGAAVYIGICSDCKEHCEAVDEEDDHYDVIEPFSKEQQETIDRLISDEKTYE